MQAPGDAHGAVELRVHGVGGPRPESVLGIARGAGEAVRVAGDEQSGFYVRPGDDPEAPALEAQLWGNLTSRSRLQPLWILLLPFTLLNVAGWLHQPPRADAPEPWWLRLHRPLVRLLALTLTMTSVIWFAILLMDQLAWQLAVRWTSSVGARVAAGAVLVLLLIAAAFWLARRTQVRFEQVAGPPGPAAGPSLPGPPGELGEPGVWEQPRGAARLLAWHLLAALVAWAAAVAQALAWGRAGRPWLELGGLFILLGGVQLALLAGVLLLDVAGRLAQRRRPDAARDRWPRQGDRFRWLAPATAAALAVALSNASLAGWVQVADWLLERLAGPGPYRTGAEFALLDVAGLLVLVALVAAAATLWWRRRVPRGEVDRVLGEIAVDRAFAVQVVRARRFSELGRNLDRVLALPGLGFLALGVLAGLPRLARRPDGDPWPWLPTMRFDPEGLAFLPAGAQAWLRSVAGVVLVALTLLSLALVWLGRGSPRIRRATGVLWDVLTFWPRRYHPLAVRPYAERVVPELQRRVLHHLERGRRVVLAGYSQGSVLAFAALLSRPHLAAGTGLVTMGSPLAQLYARFFPAHLGAAGQFAALRALIAEVNPGLGDMAWATFWRDTDYIGKQVFGGGSPDDRQLPDPPVVDPAQPPPRAVAANVLRAHLGYFDAAEVEGWTLRLRTRLAGSPAPPGDG
jgi:hypothetical protein